MATILQPKRSFTVTGADGNPVVFKGGETFHKDSPRLKDLSSKQIAENFDEWRPDNDMERTERATAGPGEKRATAPRKKD